MYRWTDSDVKAIVGLVTRSLCSADNVDESLQQLLQELSGALNADGWVFETGRNDLPAYPLSPASPVSLRPPSQWTEIKSLVSEGLSETHSVANGRRYPFYTDRYASKVALVEKDCLVGVTECACQAGRAPHPVIACVWSNNQGQTRCLEYSRAVGKESFTDRDQAILRVLARQLEQVAAGAGGLIAKNHPAHGLSRRQREVLELLLVGKNCKQIAAELRLSVYTVNDYIKAIYRRYEVSCRAELLAAVHVGA